MFLYVFVLVVIVVALFCVLFSVFVFAHFAHTSCVVFSLVGFVVVVAAVEAQ